MESMPRTERPDTQIRHAKLTELAISMVRTRMSEGITLASIAKRLRISRCHLSRIFAEQKGEPFSRFLMRERLKLAERLLRDVNFNVSEVAYQCGFKNPSHFSTWFRRGRQKLSPTAYRSQILRK